MESEESEKKKATKEIFLPEQKFKDKYQLIRKIAEGGFGTVFLIKSKLNNKEYALKTFKIQSSAQAIQEQYNTIISEIDTQMKAVHKNILRPKEYFLCTDLLAGKQLLVLVLQYADGGTLDDLQLQHEGQLKEHLILEIFEQVVDAIKFLHKQKIVHRDIKMNNILFKKGIPKVSDLGLARAKECTKQSVSVAGNENYFCPEQFEALERYENEGETHLQLDTSHDIWQLGVLLYQMCTCEVPYPIGGLSNEDLLELMKHQKFKPIPASNYSSSLQDLIKQFLMPNPNDRITLKDALGQIQTLRTLTSQHKDNYANEGQKLHNQGILPLKQPNEIMKHEEIKVDDIQVVASKSEFLESTLMNKDQQMADESDFAESTLLNKKQKNWLKGQIKTINDYKEITLIFRGSRDGFTAKKFHQNCDSQGPTISIIKSEFGQTFGGFASISWDRGNQWRQDDKAFLFQLDRLTRHNIYQYPHYALCFNSNWLMVFGGGHDIRIQDQCNLNQSSFANFGNTYKPPDDIKYQTNEAKQYMAGQDKFKVEEIEVFKLK